MTEISWHEIWKATHKQNAPECMQVGWTHALVEMQAWEDGKQQLCAELLVTDSTQSTPVHTGKPESALWGAEVHLCPADPREPLTVLLVGSDLYLTNCLCLWRKLYQCSIPCLGTQEPGTPLGIPTELQDLWQQPYLKSQQKWCTC